MDTILNDFLNSLKDEDKIVYSEIAIFAYKLGYKAKKAKTKDINYVFTSSKTKKHVLKFSYKENKPQLKMKFYASQDYSKIFHDSVKNVIEEYDFKYTGCYKCGKCKESPIGYIYEYPDSKRYFRCGNELIDILAITKEHVPEILRLIKTQHEYYLSNSKGK